MKEESARNRSMGRSSVRFWVGASGLAVTSALLISEAAVAESEAPADKGLQEIVVTAQKREEDLQGIPVAVTAIGPQEIENAQIRSFTDLSGVAPNVNVTWGSATAAPIIVMRGIQGYNLAIGTDSAVATYVDNVYYSRLIGTFMDTADLVRVEVLRGPQGTLYGRNSTGGAINFITTGPKGEFSARQEVTVGNFSQFRTKTRIDLPSFGAFSISGTFSHTEIDGYVKNITGGLTRDFSLVTRGALGSRTTPDWFGANNAESALGAVAYRPDSIPLQADYRFLWSRGTRSTNAGQVLGIPNTAAGTAARNIFNAQALTGGTGTISLTALDAIADAFSSPEETRSWGHALTVTLDLPGNVKLTSITGYHGHTDTVTNDLSGNGRLLTAPGGNPFILIGSTIAEKGKQFSEEMQLSHSSDVIDAIGGLIYSRENTNQVNPTFANRSVPFGTVPAGLVPYQSARAKNKSIAGYLQPTWHVTNKLDLTGGVRHTRDTRSTDSMALFQGQVIGLVRQEFQNTSVMANITYQPTSDAMAYAKVSTGYLSGGIYNGISFDPEKVTQYETGAKLDLLDRRLRVNTALFYSDYTDKQVGQLNAQQRYIYQNAGKARIYGAEVEITAVPTERLNLEADYGYTNFKYEDFFIGGRDQADTIGLGRVPEHTLALAAGYSLPKFANGMAPSFNLGARWHSKMDTALFIATYSPALLAATRDNSFWDVDARASLASIPLTSDMKGRVSLWARNLLNENKLLDGVDATLVVIGNFGRGRTYGADFTVEF